VKINFHNNRPIGILLPTSVVLEVVETDRVSATQRRPIRSSPQDGDRHNVQVPGFERRRRYA